MQQNNVPNGQVKDDGYHIGHFLMDFFNKNAEDHVWQIDAGTGASELKSSVKHRSIQLARCLRHAGLVTGDVVVVSGFNHLDVHIPYYAGYMNGLPLSGIDPTFKYDEVKILLNITRPKLVLCEVSNMGIYEKVSRDLGLSTRLVTFGDSENSLAKFIQMYDDNAPESEFRVANYNASEVFAWLISTSGTTGLPKVAAFKHSDIVKVLKLYALMKQKDMAKALNVSSVQWISAYFATLCMPSANHIKVQTSLTPTLDHVIDIINKYKPVISTSSPMIYNGILKQDRHCDLTCFNKIVLTGFAMNPPAVAQLKARMKPDAIIWNLLGQTECLGGLLMPAPHGPPGNVGVEMPEVKVRLVDLKTEEVITEPNKIGQLWSKGPMFTEYYNNPEATAGAFTPDGWYKTGDMVYRDENGFYFYVDRMSSSFRVGSSVVTPMELEFVINDHPDVFDVCVLGVPHPEYEMQAFAVVQRLPGSTVTEQEIKDLVADKLSYYKHLHGGVMFIDSFPRTPSGKIARAKVRDFVLEIRKSQESEYPSSGNTKKLISTFQQLSSINNVRYVSTGRH